MFKIFTRKTPCLSCLGLLESSRTYLALIFSVLFFLLFWMSRAEIDRVVRVEGRIVPSGHSQQIQHFEGGIVASILTHEGAEVKEGEVLLAIDNTLANSNLATSESKLSSLKLRALRLEAETRGEKTLSLPNDKKKQEVASAEKNLFASRQRKIEKDLVVHRELIRQHSAAYTDAQEKLNRLNNELEIARQRRQMLENLQKKGAVSQIEVLESKSRESRLETEREEAKSAAPREKGIIAEENAKIEAIQAEFKSSAQNDLVETLAEIEKIEKAKTVEEDRVNRTEIRAPIAGTVNKLNVNTIGGVIKPGESLIEITPHTKEVLIEAKAAPRDRGELRSGLKATVKVTAYDASEIGSLTGVVTEVSADTMQDARSDPYYRTKILVPSLPDAYENKPMIPGMTILGDVVIGKRTIMNYLLSPLRKFSNNMFRDTK